MKRVLSVLLLGLALALPQAQAGMIATDAAGDERARVRAMLERPEAVAELEKMGIRPQDARDQVDAMNDQEVLQLAGRLDQAAAGGQVGDRTLLLILLIILLLILL
jgi:hypothetical protein